MTTAVIKKAVVIQTNTLQMMIGDIRSYVNDLCFIVSYVGFGHCR